MPAWIHDRAEHIRSKNPSMPESESWAIATQQSHALGKSPKSYGTTKGRSTAKKKYKTPEDDVKTAQIDIVMLKAFVDEMQKIGTPVMPVPKMKGLVGSGTPVMPMPKPAPPTGALNPSGTNMMFSPKQNVSAARKERAGSAAMGFVG